MILLRVSLVVCVAAGEVVPGGGWLPRAVQLRRGLFLNDVRDLAPAHIKASLRHSADVTDAASEGAWDYRSVSRLLALLGASEGAASVRRALRRRLRLSPNTRRFMSRQQSWNMFPSLGKENHNEIYYDFDSASEEVAMSDESGWDSDRDVLVLENPVEARLPGAQISVKLLRDILEARALAARNMPSTARSTIAWITLNKTTAGNNMTSGGQNDSNATGATDSATDASNNATEAGSSATEAGSATEVAGGNTSVGPAVAEEGTTAVPAAEIVTAAAEGGETSTDAAADTAPRLKRGSDHLENSRV